MFLHSIYSRKTGKEILKEKSKRWCELDFTEDNKQMIIKYDDGGTLKHFEEVIEINQD